MVVAHIIGEQPLQLKLLDGDDVVQKIPPATPGLHGMTYTEENWVDNEETSHRGFDE